MRAHSLAHFTSIALLLAACGSPDAERSAQAGNIASRADARPDSLHTDGAAPEVAAPEAGKLDAGPTGLPTADVVAPTQTFTIAAIADPHVTTPDHQSDHYVRLAAAITWINDHVAGRKIELVLVLGDIAWGQGLETARAALDRIIVPWVPVIGDNVIFAGDEKGYDDTFGPVYAALAGRVAHLSRAPTPVTDGLTGKPTLLQNLSFDLHGVHVVALDISPRTKAGPIGEQGDLHDYPGGSWPWLQADLAKLSDRPRRSVLIASHIPMHRTAGALSKAQMKKVNALIDSTNGLVHANIAGHYHVDVTIQTQDMDFVSYVVSATFAGPFVHLATATVGGPEVLWKHEKVLVPGLD